MIDSTDVLNTVMVAYTVYAVAILSLFAWFAHRVTRGEGGGLLKPAIFYAYIGALVFSGVAIHMVTFNQLPWVELELKKDSLKPDLTFDITVKDHAFQLPSPTLEIPCGQVVMFDVTSEDLTYGFGLVRPDQSLVLQFQVIPGSENRMPWRFEKNGTYSIRSTEYSGPAGARMVVPDAVRVRGCQHDDPRAAGKEAA